MGFLGHYEASEIMKTMIRSVPNAYLGQVPIDKNTNIKLCTKLREAKNTKKVFKRIRRQRTDHTITKDKPSNDKQTVFKTQHRKLKSNKSYQFLRGRNAEFAKSVVSILT